MAQRYGRNRRRRAREQIEQLQDSLQHAKVVEDELRHQLQNSLSHLQTERGEKAALHEAITYARRMLGDNTIVFPPQDIKRLRRPYPGDFFLNVATDTLKGSAVSQAKHLRMLLCKVESDYDIRTRCRLVHGRVDLAGEAAVYVIEEEALQSVDPGTLAHILAQQAADALLPEIRKHVLVP